MSTRYHPGGYKDLGIDVEPTSKLGTKAAALEAQGIVTAAGRDNTERVLRQLLVAGVGIDSAAATPAADTIGRRAVWARMELKTAERQGNPEREAFWRREESTAVELAAAVLKISSARPVGAPMTTTSTRVDTTGLAAALAASARSEASPDGSASNRSRLRATTTGHPAIRPRPGGQAPAWTRSRDPA